MNGLMWQCPHGNDFDSLGIISVDTVLTQEYVAPIVMMLFV